MGAGLERVRKKVFHSFVDSQRLAVRAFHFHSHSGSLEIVDDPSDHQCLFQEITDFIRMVSPDFSQPPCKSRRLSG